MLHGVVGFQGLHHLGHGGALLADGHVDADDAGVPLVDDGVQGHGGLAGLAVADDQLALAAADGDQGVDGLEPGLHGLLDAFAVDDAGGDLLDRVLGGGGDGALAVDGVAQGVHHPADEGRAHRHRHDPAGALDRVAFLDGRGLAQQDDADVVLFQVEGHAHHPVRKFKQLPGHGLLQAVGPGDAVADADDRADLGNVGLGVEAFDLAANDAGNFFRADVHIAILRNAGKGLCGKQAGLEQPELALEGSVVDRGSDLGPDPPEHRGILAPLQLDGLAGAAGEGRRQILALGLRQGLGGLDAGFHHAQPLIHQFVKGLGQLIDEVQAGGARHHPKKRRRVSLTPSAASTASSAAAFWLGASSG